MQTSVLELTLAVAAVRFTCDDRGLLEYSRAHLQPLLQKELGEVDIVSRLRWHEGHPPQDVAAAYPEVKALERVDRDLYLGPKRIVWLRVDDLRDLHLRFEWDGQRLLVEGDFYHRLSKSPGADRARRLLYRGRLGMFRRKRYTRLLYYLVYYPVFWWAEHLRGAHPIHAGAVDSAGGALVLAGPSGVGKSTLTVALSGEPGATMMSDTFLLHHGPEIWAVPEPFLLDAWSRSWLSEAGNVLHRVADHPYALGRGGFVLPTQRIAARGRATAVVLPRRSPKRFVREISSAEAAARMDAYDDIVNDLRRYRAFAAVLELLGPIGLARARIQSLEQLTSSARCYEVGLTPHLSRSEAVRLLWSLCNGSDGEGTRERVRGRG